MVPQGMPKLAIARGLQPELHHFEARELSVRPTLIPSSRLECLLLRRSSPPSSVVRSGLIAAVRTVRFGENVIVSGYAARLR